MKLKDTRTVLVACCPLCGGEPLKAKEFYQIANDAPGINGLFIHGRFKVRCDKCFCGMDVDFCDEVQTLEEAEDLPDSAYVDFENHWARMDYKEVANES